MSGEDDITELPLVVDVQDQPCQQLYEGNPVLLGFDVVQYHFIPPYNQGGVAVRGLPEFAYNFQGYQFWFSTAENRETFREDPWRYAPAWGGFCSWGVALELPPKWPWQPNFLGPPASPWNGWLIVNGTLMFNIWASYSDRFMENLEPNVAAAKTRWEEWFGGELHAGPFNTHCIGHGPLQNWCLAQQPSPWLEALPECDSNDETVSSTAAGGGGIVSDKNAFGDFENARYTPRQQRIIKALSFTAFVVAFLAVTACLACFCRRRRANGGKRDAGNTVVSEVCCDSDEITPPHESEDD